MGVLCGIYAALVYRLSSFYYFKDLGISYMSFFSIVRSYNKSRKPPTCTAVIAAAGTSQRCKGEDKLFYRINGRPVLAYAIDAFECSKLIDDIIIVARAENFERIGIICSNYGLSKVSKIIKGGEARHESVLSGIYAASDKAKLIAIHDGARPCLDVGLLEMTIHAAAKYHAAAPAVAIASTVKRVEGSVISETVSREGLFEIQTPQIFRAEIIKAALTNAMKSSIDITDDCMAAELIGVPVHIVEGTRRNIKITENDDLYIVESLIKEGLDLCE